MSTGCVIAFVTSTFIISTGCVIAFVTGCPCFLICVPVCRRFYDKYLDPAKIVRDNINVYLPGVIVHEDGTIEDYEVSPEEIDCIVEIIDEAMQ